MDTPFNPSEELIQQVWETGRIIIEKDPRYYRADVYGYMLRRDYYGKDRPMGWNPDHMIPRKYGGSDTLENLQILQSNKNKELGCSRKKRLRTSACYNCQIHESSCEIFRHKNIH